VMFVAGCPTDSSLLTWSRPRRYTYVCQLVPLVVRVLHNVRFLQKVASVNLHSVRVKKWDVLVCAGEEFVCQHDYRHLITFCVVERVESVVKAFDNITRGDYHPGKLAVSGMQGKAEITLFRSRRHTCCRSRPLPENYHRTWCLGYSRPSQSFGHKGEAGARGRG